MSYYIVTATTASTLHPRAAARLGFRRVVPGEVHQIDDDVAAPFCAHTDDVVVGQKRDTATGDMVDVTRKVDRPGIIKKTTKKRAREIAAEAADAVELDDDETAGADETDADE